jgi:hypothetical protein
MIALLFLAMAWLNRKYPDTYPLLPALFLLVAPVAMAAEGLQ